MVSRLGLVLAALSVGVACRGSAPPTPPRARASAPDAAETVAPVDPEPTDAVEHCRDALATAVRNPAALVARECRWLFRGRCRDGLARAGSDLPREAADAVVDACVDEYCPDRTGPTACVDRGTRPGRRALPELLDMVLSRAPGLSASERRSVVSAIGTVLVPSALYRLQVEVADEGIALILVDGGGRIAVRNPPSAGELEMVVSAIRTLMPDPNDCALLILGADALSPPVRDALLQAIGAAPCQAVVCRADMKNCRED